MYCIITVISVSSDCLWFFFSFASFSSPIFSIQIFFFHKKKILLENYMPLSKKIVTIYIQMVLCSLKSISIYTNLFESKNIHSPSSLSLPCDAHLTSEGSAQGLSFMRSLLNLPVSPFKIMFYSSLFYQSLCHTYIHWINKEIKSPNAIDWYLCLPPPKICMFKPYPQCNGIWNWALGSD